LVLAKIGRGDHFRYWVFHRRAGPGGSFRQLLVLPRNQTTRQHLNVLRRLSQGNPNLPTILDFHRQANEFVVVTTWVHGRDLASYLTRDHSRPVAWRNPIDAMKLYRGLAHGLSHMHRRPQVVHGDIKPANLVVAKSPRRLVMIDFGSAWTIEKSCGREAGDGTTPSYAAPEQLDDRQLADFRSDQFSACVVAYRMLTGELPYGGMGGKAGLPQNRSVYESRYRPPSQLCPHRKRVPRRIWKVIDEVLTTGLALDTGRRFQSSPLWLDALEDLYCEMRRKVRFGFWDSVLIRLFERLGRLRGGQDEDQTDSLSG
jgi:serine/threonine protein kinase